MDSIHITGIRAYGYLGVLPEEQSLGQWFQIDLTVWRDLSQASNSDNLEETFDYRQIVQQVQTLIQTTRCQLIETATESVAQLVLADAMVQQVRVRLTKERPPIPNFTGQVTVEMTRSRQVG
ncbi:MAG: dihydroneopterin aldolase [Synechococcales cyanobacterium M58_A2018_015]|nr:dihydroneopterin aldolase [Synechococcales cyanobacterium M58_A2018_015]